MGHHGHHSPRHARGHHGGGGPCARRRQRRRESLPHAELAAAARVAVVEVLAELLPALESGRLPELTVPLHALLADRTRQIAAQGETA